MLASIGSCSPAHLFAELALLQEGYNCTRTSGPIDAYAVFGKHGIDKITGLALLYNVLEAAPRCTDHWDTTGRRLCLCQTKIFPMIEAQIDDYIRRSIHTSQILPKKRPHEPDTIRNS